jgi:hypothetical protein
MKNITPATCPHCGKAITQVIEEYVAPYAIKAGTKAGKLDAAKSRIKELESAKTAADAARSSAEARVAHLEAEVRALASRLVGAGEETRSSRQPKSGHAARALSPAQLAVVANMR